MMRFGAGDVPPWLQRIGGTTGGDAMLRDLAHQHRDTLRTLDSQRQAAASVADTLRQAGRATLLGMGGSHHANHIAATRLRAAGINAVAVPASEAVYAPLPQPGPVILTSQSGGSAEVKAWLQQHGPTDVVAGLTLSPDAPYGPDVPTLVAEGGAEHGFAATRSFALTLALYAAVLDALGASADDKWPEEEPPVDPAVEQALDHLRDAEAFVFSARGAFDGLAVMAALATQELGRIPAMAFEAGQFHHGPVELLDPTTAVVILRSSGDWRPITDICARAGAPTVVLDASGEPPITDTVTLNFPSGIGLAAVYAMLPSVQALTMGLTAHVDNFGAPKFLQKVITS